MQTTATADDSEFGIAKRLCSSWPRSQRWFFCNRRTTIE